MPELTDVLGTILRDVAKSRVVSDLFSRDISQEYQEDPILIDFPVPRVEIKEATLALKLAINEVEQRSVDLGAIREALISRHALAIGQKVYAALILAHPNAESLEALSEEKNLDIKARLSRHAEQLMGTHLPDLSLESLSDQSLKGISQALKQDLEKTLRSDQEFWETLRKGVLVREIQASIEEQINSGLSGYIDELKAAESAADRQTFSVDVAVTRSELLEVPDPVLSQISLTTEIRNYEWVDIGEEDGKPIRRLRPE